MCAIWEIISYKKCNVLRLYSSVIYSERHDTRLGYLRRAASLRTTELSATCNVPLVTIGILIILNNHLRSLVYCYLSSITPLHNNWRRGLVKRTKRIKKKNFGKSVFGKSVTSRSRKTLRNVSCDWAKTI